MTLKYQDKYRIPSARLPSWDYGWNAAYFVTICTKGRICYFGDIVDGNMKLSDIGKIAIDCWKAIPIHFPFVVLDAYVVMPNHVHGIIVIDKPEKVKTQDIAVKSPILSEQITVETQDIAVKSPNLSEPITVETQDIASLPSEPTKNKFGPQSKNLASIIRGYKIGVTKNARMINADFAWQERYLKLHME